MVWKEIKVINDPNEYGITYRGDRKKYQERSIIIRKLRSLFGACPICGKWKVEKYKRYIKWRHWFPTHTNTRYVCKNCRWCK